MDPTPPSAAMRASSSDTAADGSARHKRAECRRQRLVGREAGGPGPVGERLGPLERSVSVLVKTAGRRLPGQHLHGNGGVGRVAQLVPELGCLSGIGEGSGVVAEPRSRGGEQCQRRHQDAERTAVPDLAQLIGAHCHGEARVTEEAAGQTEEEQRRGSSRSGGREIRSMTSLSST